MSTTTSDRGKAASQLHREGDRLAQQALVRLEAAAQHQAEAAVLMEKARVQYQLAEITAKGAAR